jgi:hypothetical protein
MSQWYRTLFILFDYNFVCYTDISLYSIISCAWHLSPPHPAEMPPLHTNAIFISEGKRSWTSYNETVL